MQLSEKEPDVVITVAELAESDTNVLIIDETGVITQVISSPVKQKTSTRRPIVVHQDVHEVAVTQVLVSQVLDPSQDASASGNGHI